MCPEMGDVVGARLPELIKLPPPKCRLSQVWTVGRDPRPCVLKVVAGREAIVIKVTGVHGGGVGSSLGCPTGCGHRPMSKGQGSGPLGAFLPVGVSKISTRWC